MNSKFESIGFGPAIASADAMFKSDNEALNFLRSEIGWAIMCASSAQFALSALSKYGARGNANALSHILQAGTEQIKRKLNQESVDGEFDATIAYGYSLEFLRSAIIDPLRGDSLNCETSISLSDKKEEKEFVAALAAVNQFVILFEVHLAYRSGSYEVSPEFLIAGYRAKLVESQIAKFATQVD